MSGGQRTLFYLLSFFIPVVGIVLEIVWINDVDFDKKSVEKTVCLSLSFPLFSAAFVGLLYLLYLSYRRIVYIKRYLEPNSLLDELGFLSMGNTVFSYAPCNLPLFSIQKKRCRIWQSSF